MYLTGIPTILLHSWSNSTSICRPTALFTIVLLTLMFDFIISALSPRHFVFPLYFSSSLRLSMANRVAIKITPSWTPTVVKTLLIFETCTLTIIDFKGLVGYFENRKEAFDQTPDLFHILHSPLLLHEM